MSLRKKVKIKKETLLFIVGSLLLIIALTLFYYDKIIEVSNELKSNIETEIYKEKTKNHILVNVTTDYLEDEPGNNKENENNYVPNYIAFLEIEKINLKQGLLSIDNPYNYVDYHVQILSISDFPDVINGNFILAGHSGTSSVAYFKNLYKLNTGDEAKVYYNSKVYKYQIVDIYNEVKDGSVTIRRDNSKTTLTLITCTKDDKEHQTIYILELKNVENY